MVVTDDKALLWTDGRYFVQVNAILFLFLYEIVFQAEKQLTKGWTLMKQGLPDSVTPEDWIADNLKSGDRVGFDPNLHRYGMNSVIYLLPTC